MKTYDRELELSFEVSAAKAIKIMTRENLVILQQHIIRQTWLEEGKVGNYKFRTRIRRTKISYPDTIAEKKPENGSWPGKCEFTTKYSKNDEKAAKQDNMELNAEITLVEYARLKKIYEAADKEKKEARVKKSERTAKRNGLLNEASNKMAEVKKAREALSAAQKTYAETIKKINEFDIENKYTREINVFNYDSALSFIFDLIGDF